VDSYGNPVSVNTDSDSPASTSALDKIKQLASELNDDDRAVAKSFFQQDSQSGAETPQAQPQQQTPAPATVASQTRVGKQAAAAQAAQNQMTPKSAAPKPAVPQTPDQIRAAKQATAAANAQQQMTPKPAVPQTRPQGGGRVAGQLSQSPRAVSRRAARAAPRESVYREYGLNEGLSIFTK
jgi:hypothetical protein